MESWRLLILDLRKSSMGIKYKTKWQKQYWDHLSIWVTNLFILSEAPEILEGKPYGPIAEIYSLGVILYLMVFGKPPFEYKNFFLPDEKELAN